MGIIENNLTQLLSEHLFFYINGNKFTVIEQTFLFYIRHDHYYIASCLRVIRHIKIVVVRMTDTKAIKNISNNTAVFSLS